MRKTFDRAEKYRVNLPGFPPTRTGDRYGLFIVSRPNIQVRIIVADGEDTGWEHVSVSCKVSPPDGKGPRDMLPPWGMMQEAKEMFWEDDECVIQFHPPKSDYVNRAEVLHLWKPVGPNLPTPPAILIG